MGTKRRFSGQELEADHLQVEFEKIYPADIKAMELMVAEVMTIISSARCAVGREFEIELALREALANAILHGSGSDVSKPVKVTVACADTIGLLLIISDSGSGFNPTHVPSPIVGENIFSNHGRGIFLINQLMDEVRFEKGGAEIHMLKRTKDNCSQAPASPQAGSENDS